MPVAAMEASFDAPPTPFRPRPACARRPIRVANPTRRVVWHPERRPGRVRSLSWEYPDGHRLPSHAHTSHQLYAVRGCMTLSAAGGSWIVPVHRGAWVPAGVEHAIRMSGAVSMRTLYIDP